MEKMQESINKNLKELKNKYAEINRTITDIKNTETNNTITEIKNTLLLLLLLSRFSRVRLCSTPETAAYQALLSLGFSRQEHWSGLPFPSPMHESEKWKRSPSAVSDSVYTINTSSILPSLSLPPTVSTKCILYICVSIPSLKIGSSIPFF